MQFTEEIIQDILRENEQLKTELNIAKKELGDTQSELSATQKELSAAQKELDATAALYDTMVVGTKNLLILTEGGSRSAIYVTPNVEEILGLPRDLAMRDIRELGPLSGEIPSERLFAICRSITMRKTERLTAADCTRSLWKALPRRITRCSRECPMTSGPRSIPLPAM